MILALVVLLLGGGYGWVAWQMAEERATIERMALATAAENRACAELGQSKVGRSFRPTWRNTLPEANGGAFRCIDTQGGEYYALPPLCNRYRLERCK